MKRTDYSNSQLSGIAYGGADKKVGIIYQGKYLMLKFKSKTPYGECYNDISEYLGSVIFKMLGLKAQECQLGIYNGQKVVSCEDFIFPNKSFKPFADVGESSAKQNERYSYSFKEIKKLIYDSKRFDEKEKSKFIESFWDTYIIDALLANGDRHAKNWGYLKEDNKYQVAPIFDNGNCLFSHLVDEDEMQYILSSQDELNERVMERPKSLIKNDDSISDYYTIITSKDFEDCNKAILRIVPRINLKEINELIESIDDKDMSKTRKLLLKTIIRLRYERILFSTYKDLTCKK